MVKTAENLDLSCVGRGTPMGELMRRYWHPIAASADVNDRQHSKLIKILGEELVLFRNRRGGIGLVGPRCAHRNASLLYSVPEDNGLRCCYHGWLYDQTGQCLEQPNEAKSFAKKVKIPSYPVEEIGGLIFAYLGPLPAPLLPRWDVLAWGNVTRKISAVVLPCNWLQCMENSLDPVHFEWLHRYYGTYQIMLKNPDSVLSDWDLSTQQRGKHHVKLGFELTDYGIIKRRLLEGENESEDHWRMGHPILFPNVLRVGMGNWHGLHYRVPMDDTHTLHIMCDLEIAKPDEDLPTQNVVPVTHWPLYDKNDNLIQVLEGEFEPYHVVAQDQVAWIAQGPISDRTTETLGVTDAGIVWYRQILQQQMDKVARGQEPMNVHRDPKKNQCIVLPAELSRYPGDAENETGGPFKDYTPPRPDCEMTLA